MDDGALDWDRLARYLAAECSETEEETVRRWIAADPRREQEVRLLHNAWELAAGLPSTARLDAMWERVAAGMHDSAGERPSGGGGGAGSGLKRSAPLLSFTGLHEARPLWHRRLAAAAAVILVAASGAAGLWWARGGEGTRYSAGREFRAPRGQRVAVTLIEGTRVVLGPESWMRVTHERQRMDVTLEGEAVFAIAHDATRRWVLRAGAAVAEDFGTTFGVRAYRGDPVRVVVAEGRVVVRDTTGGGSPVVLTGRDLALVSGDGRVEVEHHIDPAVYLAWTEGRLVFRRTPLAEVALQLERWFDVKVVIADSALAKARVSASFSDGALDDIVGTLAASLDARVERRGRSVYLMARQ